LLAYHIAARRGCDVDRPRNLAKSVTVEGDDSLTDTFTVEAGPALKLRAIGAISLAGVRRADIEAYLARELAKYLRNPAVQAHVLVRVAILGEVEKPGFYAVPADLVLGDAMMRAGGPTRES